MAIQLSIATVLTVIAVLRFCRLPAVIDMGVQYTALVTGGSRGIGRAIVERLASENVRVAFSFAQNSAAANEVVSTTQNRGCGAHAVRADLSKPEDALRLFDSAEAALGGPDILVNNAGSTRRHRHLSETTDADYEHMMAVNTHAVFSLMREATTRLRDNGRIINISTVNTATPTARAAVHAASKAAVERLAACAAYELGHRGITVNVVSPGATDTEALHTNHPTSHGSQFVGLTPLGRLGQPADIAAVIAFLAGPDSQWITGQNIHASGGLG